MSAYTLQSSKEILDMVSLRSERYITLSPALYGLPGSPVYVLLPIVLSAYGKTGGVFCMRDGERRLIADRLIGGLVFTGKDRIDTVNRVVTAMSGHVACHMAEHEIKTVHF